MAIGYYFIDNLRGNDAHTGLREPAGDITSVTYYTTEAGTDATHINCPTAALVETVDGAYNGDFLYNVTRGIGALITGFTHTGHIITVAIAGMDVGDTFYILKSWRTINKYTTVTTRTAGDKGYVRANQRHEPGVSITLDESGTVILRISLIGCNATQGIDPWHDASDVSPVIDFNTGAYYIDLRNYWYLKNLDFKRGYSNTYGNIYLSNVQGCLFEYIICRDTTSTRGGLYSTGYSGNHIFNYCTFSAAGNNSINASSGGLSDSKFNDCTFDSPSAGTQTGFSATGSVNLQFNNCIWGASTSFAQDLSMNYNTYHIFRNCTFNGTKYSTPSSTAYCGNLIQEEDPAGSAIGTCITTTGLGTITKCAAGLTDTTLRAGGGTSSARMVPFSFIGVLAPFLLNSDHYNNAIKIWCAAASTVITIYIRAYGTWSTYPTAAQLFISADYLSATSPYTRTTVNSTAVLSDTTTWVPFSVTVVPAVAGFVNLQVNLGLYKGASTGIYVDIVPVIS